MTVIKVNDASVDDNRPYSVADAAVTCHTQGWEDRTEKGLFYRWAIPHKEIRPFSGILKMGG